MVAVRSAVGGFVPTGPRATRVSAPGRDGFRPRSAAASTHTGLPSTQTRPGYLLLTGCSPVRPRSVGESGTQIIYVRRILLGHSLPSRSGTRHHPRPYLPEQRELVSSLSNDPHLLHDSTTHYKRSLDRTQRPPLFHGATWPFDWSCTWPGASKITHSSETCRPLPWSAGTARWTGCACPVSTPMPSSPVCWAPRNTASGGWARPTPPTRSRPPRPGAATAATR